MAAGQPALASDTVRGVAWAEMRLRGQAWYRYWLAQDYRRAADAWTTAVLLDAFGTTDLVFWRSEAERLAR